VYGVKWQDLEEATFFTGFFSWLLKSYTVRVGHRFTKSNEIIVPNVRKGHETVVFINELHSRLLEQQRI